MKIYITKYALTDGILESHAEPYNGYGIKNAVKEPGAYGHIYSGMSWYITRENAVARAEQMRVSKIRSLEKQIKRLKNLKFV